MPASGIAGSGTTCVIDRDDVHHRVSVLSSTLGRAIVSFSSPPPRAVRLDVETLTC